MNVITNEYTVFCDVDDTLVKWSNEFNRPHEGAIEFLDPYDNSINYLVPHQRHIDLLKKYQGRGMFVVVWSAGGSLWAESVVKTLNLDEYVNLIITKPAKYIDDLQANEILGQRVYLEDYEKE